MKYILGFILLICSVTSFAKDSTFILSQKIVEAGHYNNLITTLQKARSSDNVYIVLDHNIGGWIRTELKLLNAIDTTNATVYTTTRGWTSSAALAILFKGHIVRVPKRWIGEAHLSKQKNWDTRWLVPYQTFYKKVMTLDQWEAFKVNKDVQIYGTEVCRVAENKIEETSEYCVINMRR